MTVSTRNGFMSRRGCGKACVLSPLLFKELFAAALYVILVRFSEDEAVVKDLDQFNDGAALACVRRAVWGMLSSDDTGIISKSPEGLAKIMTAIASGLAVSEKKTKTILLRTPDQTTLDPPRVIEAAGQRYKQTAQF